MEAKKGTLKLNVFERSREEGEAGDSIDQRRFFFCYFLFASFSTFKKATTSLLLIQTKSEEKN